MGKKLKKTGCLLVILLSIIGISSCLWRSFDNMERRTVTVGFFEYPPYSMLDSETGRPTGYYVDILDTVAKNQNLEIKYVRTVFSDYRDSIPKGKPYIMGLPVIITRERQRVYNFSWPCDENDTTVVVKKSSHVKKDSDLKTCIVGATEGLVEFCCRKMLKDGRIKDYKAYNSTAKQYEALIAGKVDAILTDHSIALYFNSRNPNVFRINELAFKQYEYAGFPIQKKQEWLLKRVNNGLRRIMNSDEYSRIYRKYFPNEGDRKCN